MLFETRSTSEALLTNSQTILNFRDVGRSVNEIIGANFMTENRLFRGGSIAQSYAPNACGNPDLIVCLRDVVDQENWSALIHAPKPEDLECYATDEKRIQQWLKTPLSGISDLSLGLRAYVHCRLGRDRTGVVIAAILSALEVPERVIVEEFLLSDGAEKVEILRALTGMPSPRELVSSNQLHALRMNFRAQSHHCD